MTVTFNYFVLKPKQIVTYQYILVQILNDQFHQTQHPVFLKIHILFSRVDKTYNLIIIYYYNKQIQFNLNVLLINYL